MPWATRSLGSHSREKDRGSGALGLASWLDIDFWLEEENGWSRRPRGAHIGGLMTSRYVYVTVYVRNSVPYVTLRFGSRVYA